VVFGLVFGLVYGASVVWYRLVWLGLRWLQVQQVHVSQSIRRSQLHPLESAAISGGSGSLEEDEKVLVLLVF
jgi:hypothetical protein